MYRQALERTFSKIIGKHADRMFWSIPHPEEVVADLVGGTERILNESAAAFNDVNDASTAVIAELTLHENIRQILARHMQTAMAVSAQTDLVNDLAALYEREHSDATEKALRISASGEDSRLNLASGGIVHRLSPRE